MKKFMIFLLMTVLYLGTCQASSEASHPNNGKLKLLSWVSPTPSESFLTRSDAALPMADNTVFTVHVQGANIGCPGQNITLTATVDGPVSGNATYLWKLDGDATNLPGVYSEQTYSFNTDDIPLLSDGQTHEFTVEVSIANCELVKSPVHPFTVMDFTIQLDGPAYTCASVGSYDLVATVGNTSGSSPASYQWYKGATLFATTNVNTLSVSADSLHNQWKVKAVYSTMECTPESNVFEGANVPELKVEGTVSVESDAATNGVCVDAPVTFTATNNLHLTQAADAVYDLSAPTYEWYVDGQLAAATPTNTYTTSFGQTGTHNVMVKPVYDNYDCTVLPTASTTVAVEAAPALTIVGNNVICDGQSSNILTATAGFASYSWTKPAPTPEIQGNNKVQGTAPGTYYVTATTAAGCTATADFHVTQFGSDLQLTASEYYVCPGDVVVLNANLSGWTNENITYAWKQPGENDYTVGGSTLVVTVPTNATDDQTYYVKATAAEGCENEGEIIVHVVTPTQVTLNVNAGSDTCVGNQVTAIATAQSGSYSGLYDWYVNGVQVLGEHAATITMTFDQPGEYTFAAAPANTVCSAINPTAVTADNTVNVYSIPDITITGDNVICQNTTATIMATHIDGATYTWAMPVGANGNSQLNQQKDTLTTSIPGVYAVTASKGGCETTAEFTIYQLGGDLQLYASELGACQGGVVTLNANLDGFGNQNIQYTWVVEGEGSSLTATTGSTVGLNMGSVNAKVIVTAHVTGVDYASMPNHCTMSDTINIALLTSPNLDLVTVTSPTGLNMCAGDQLNAVAKVNAGTTDEPDYQNYAGHVIWYLDGVEVPGQNLSQLALNLFTEGAHTISAKAANDVCGTSAVVTADKHPIVRAIPEVTITGNNVICNGNSTTLTANVIPESNTNQAVYPTYEVTWTGPNNTTGSDYDLTTSTAGVYTVTVKETLSSCVATADFTVYTTGADLQVTADRMEICEGETVVLNANLDGFGNENVTYAWTGSGLNATAGSTVSAVPTSSGAKTYEVTATAGGCTMNGSIEITVNSIPSKPSLQLSAHNICAGEQVTLTADHAGSGQDYTYTWYQNGIVIEGENTRTITLTLNEAGEYMYRVSRTNAAGCTSQLTTPTNDYKVTVHAAPIVTLSGNHYYTTGATTATITSSVTPAGNYTYAWSNGETTPDITVSNYGVYTLTVTTQNGCVAISEPFTVSSVEDLQAHITGAEAACQHDVVTLTAIVDNDLEGHTYRWLVNNQYITDAHGISGSETANLTFPVDSIYTYYGAQFANEFTVEIYREGCIDPSLSPVHPFMITPVPYVVVSAPEKVCEGSDAILEAVVYQIGDNAQYQYQWYQDDEETTYGDPIDYVNTITIPAADVADHQYAVKVIYQDVACSSDLSAFVAVEIYEAPAPIALHMDPSTICTSNQASVWIEDANANAEGFGAATYSWYVNGFAMPLAQGDTLVVDFDHNGQYTFWATAQYAEYPCGLNYTDTLTQNVVMHPTVQITGDPILCDANNVELFAIINDTVGTLDYQFEWRLYNNSLSGMNSNDTITQNQSGPYGYQTINNGNTIFNVYASNDPWLTVNGISAQDYPYIFTVVVTTPEGCRVESDPYYVYVGDSIEVVATVDFDTVCANGEITAIAHLGNWNMDNLTAIWQYSNDGGETWNNIDYGTSGILHHVPGDVANGNSTVLYRIRVEQTTTGCVAYSNPVSVDIIEPAQISSVVAINGNVNFPTDNVCEGAQLEIKAYMYELDADGNRIQKVDENGNLVFDADGQPVYREYINNDLNYMWKLNGMELQTVHGAEFSAQAYIYDGDPVDYTYEAYIVYDIPGCEAVPVASNTVHVKRNPIVTIDGNPNVCYYGPGVENIVLTAWVNGVVDLDATYTWYESGQYRPNPSGFDNNYRESWVPTYENPYIFTVLVTNGDGCTTLSDPFYVNVYERPYTNITADATEICEGGNVTLRANLNNYNDPMLTYQWYKDEVNNTHILPGATHEIETFEPVLGATNYIVKVTHLMDFNTQYCVAYDTIRVDVNPIPVVEAMFITPDQTTVCEGQTVTIMAGVVDGGVEGGEIYTWYRNGEVIEGFHESVLTDNPVAVDGEPTIYHYAVSVKQSASGCESLIYDQLDDITVNPNPVVELVTDPIVCDTTGNNITLLANVQPEILTPVSYKWMENNEVMSITETNTISFHKDYRDYPYSFSVQLVNDYGCVSEASALVYVNAEPVVAITATDTNICNGGEITLTANLADWNAGELTYRWYDGNTAIANATELSYTVVPTPGVHKYTIQIDQLTSLCHATSDTITVVVNNDPTVVLNYAAAQYTVCDGYQVDLTTTVTGGVTGGEVFTWYRNGQVIEGATASTYSEVVSALNGEPTTYNYAVSVAQAAPGCESNVYDALQTITVNPNPVVVLVTDPIVCVEEGNNITLTANMDPTNVGSDVTFNWMEDNATLAAGSYTVVSNNQITLHKPYRDYPYNFSVQVVNDYACSASSEAQVYVNANPIVNTTVTETNICVGGDITMALNLNDWNADQLTFQWYRDGDSIPGATSLTYTEVPAVGEHEYYVKVYQLTSGCQAQSVPFTVTVNPDPIVTNVTVSDVNVCNGAQITVAATIDAHGMPTDGAVYTWYRNGIMMPNATTATILDNPSTIDNNIQHYTYAAVVTLPQTGCSSLFETSATASVNVYPNPVVVITGDQHVCETDSVFLIANVDTTAFAVGNLHYTWYESGQIRNNDAYGLGDSKFYAEYLYPRDEPYIFTVNVERDDITAACASMSNEFYVYVYPQPVVTVTATETLVCTDGEVTLTANLQDYNMNNLTYQWYEIREHDVTTAVGYNEDHSYIYETNTVQYRYFIPGATMPTYTVNPNVTTTYGVVVYQTNSTCYDDDEITITVNPIPEVTAVLVSNDTVCEGTQVTISATIDTHGTPANGAVYTWYRNGEEIVGVTGASFSENVFTTDDHITVNSYTAVVTLPVSGCVSLMSAPTTVTVMPAPTTVSISGDNVICENDSTILTVYSNVPGNITWSTGSHENTIMVPAGTYTVTVETLGCQMTSEPFTVEAFGTDLLVSASATSICRGEHTTLYVNQDGWQGNVTYQWDAQAGNSTATTVDVQPDSTTTYHVTAIVTSTNGAAGACTAEGEVTIIVHQLPAAFNVTANVDTICEGQQITFTAPVDPQVTGYIWYQNGVEIPGENQNVLTVNFNEAGNYTFAAKAISVEGCISADASAPVTVTVNPAPSTVTISGHNILCLNDSTTLHAYSDVPGTFTWSNGTVGATTVVTAGVYNVTIETAEGCTMTSDNFTVESFGTDLIVSASATSICQGEHTTLYVDQDGWQGNVSYTWSTGSHAATIDVTPEMTTTYTVTATVSNENGSCEAVGEITIIVTPRPETVVVTVVEDVDTICVGQQTMITASGNAAAYMWYVNGVLIPGENLQYLVVNQNEPGVFAYQAKAINEEGCVSEEYSNIALVTVKPAPTTVTITGHNMLCLNDSTVLTAHSDVPGTFTWNDGTVGVNKTVTAGVYNVTLTTAEGCSMTSENFTVISAGTDLLVSASATAICEGEHTTLYVDQDGWQGNVTYAWSNGSTATTVDVQPEVTTTYTVTATVNNENGSCTFNGEVTIVVTPRPAKVVVTASTDTICEGQQITFNASGNAYSYIWYQNGVEIPGENQAVLTVNFNEAGNYTFAAKAVNDQNCESAEASDPVTVTVNPAPSTVTITGNNVICLNDATVLTAHSDVAGTFTWNDGTVGATNEVTAGVYNVTLTTPEGCSMTSENFTVESFGTDLLVSASATNICEGEHTTLYVNQDGWQGNVSYAWSTGSNATTVDVQPDTTTTYTVTATVSNENGHCVAVGEVTINVNPKPAAPIVIVPIDTICAGQSFPVVLYHTPDNTIVTWYVDGVEVPGENTPSMILTAQAGPHTISARVISDEGCVSDLSSPVAMVQGQMFAAYYVGIEAPTSVTISADYTTICDGGMTTLYANVDPTQPAAYDNNPITYNWFMDGVAIDIHTPSIDVTTAGSYSVEAAFHGCATVSAPVVVTVEETPQVQLTATETEICAGGSTVITAEATGHNNGEFNYTWNNGFVGSSYTFNSTTAGTYTFMVTVSQGTSGCNAADTITINVNEVPATPVVTVDNAVVCDGGQVTLTVTNPNSNATYTWMKNGVVILGANGPVIYDSPVTVDGDQTGYVYTVFAELPISGCTSQTSANTVVTVIPTPAVAVSVEGNTTVCAGGTTTLHANVTPANANYNYQWYKDNVLIENATEADYVAAEVARETAYNYTVVVTANPGCNVTSAPTAITFVVDPIVEATISNNISCVGGTATLTAAVVNGGVQTDLSLYTFDWYSNNNEYVGSGATYTTSANDGAGNYTYWVTVTNNYGCQGTSQVVNYSVVADPVVTIAVATGYPTTVCNNGATMLKANVAGGYGEQSYQWFKNGNLLVGETNQTLALDNLLVGVNDVYTVEVMQTGVGCGNVASAAINTLVTVAPTYTVDITGFGNVCEGGTLTLNATVNGVIAGDVLTYQWYRVSNGSSTAIYGANAAQYQTSDLLLGDSYEYYVVVTSNISGCSVVSTSVPASVVAAPTVAIQGANTVCEGGNLTLNAFVNGGVEGGAYTYTWNWTGAATGTATTAVPTFVPTLSANDVASPYYFTVTITRNDNTGCTATSEAHEVNVLAIPTVSVTADNSYVCQNGVVTFTAHVSPVGAYNYVWTINGQQQAVNAATISTSMPTTGTINASVVVSAANASSSCSATATIATPVQVVAVPTVTLAANNTTMCVGGVTTLTATVNANSNIPGNFNYEWIVDGTPVAGVTNTLNQTLTTAGIHNYKVRVSQDNNLGCASDWSNQATVQVAEQPVVTLSSEDGLAICEGGSINLTAVVTNYNTTVNGVTNSAIYGNMVFDWTSNGINIHHNTSNTAMNQVTETLNTVGNYTYQVTVDPAGYNCQPQVSNEYTVSVVGQPSWTDVHVYSNNGTDACLGEMVYLMAGIQGGAIDVVGSTSGHIQWVVTDSLGNTVAVDGGLGGTSYDIPDAPGTYIYTPTFLDNIGNGCQLNNNVAQVAVTVHELPTAEFVSGDGTTLCANDPSASAELVIAFTGVAPFTYEVVDNEGNVIAHATTMTNTATIYVAPEHQTTYRINLISDNFCENPAVGDAIAVTVYVNDIEFTETTFAADCDANEVTIYFNAISGPMDNATITYSNGATYTATELDQNSATFATPTEPGTYDATVTIDGCTYDITVKVPMSVAYNYTGTLPLMDQRWNDVVVVNCNPETNGGHEFVGFQWYHNGVLIPGATFSNYQDKGGLNGFYSVELVERLADGTMVTYMACEMPFDGISFVKVYPVPAHVQQEVTIELDLTSEELEGAVLDIFSVTGALISHVTDLQPITKIEGFKAQGTYFGRILTGTNDIKTVKFIIVK